ncbi:TonB-dependent receptor [Mucilaginibacter myungsuensis]|uniref:TonB-dependent receptor n=1 Tax=Mucilaginibacter myungsuensis TaxID=649104 RepID=A0A929KVN6_9SPHI|nr:TonB-dependent receptor [Mucilaginibacter myungsuensis]MBE9661288.1 TonB-dependent receptor [Mucilaginibacter myungsuensis]MDN3597431.1 TonB-dependent receptor [Mucilaginibacter myungsuensis]
MKLRIFGFLLLQLIFVAAKANVIAITGKVIDAKDKSTLPGATVSIPDLKLSAATDANGNFSFRSLPNRGKILMEVQYVGYKAMTKIVDLPLNGALVFELQPTSIETREIVITGTPTSSNSKRNSTSVSTLNKNDLQRPSTNLIDAIAKQVPGVSQITTGPSISKPVIRGLSANRVVTMDGGVKQQGQQFGDEHGMEIDQFKVDRVEVLKGAASLIYGSDALGGVLNFLDPLTTPDGQIRGELSSNYQTNSGLTGNSLMLTGNENGFVWRGRGSYKNAHSFNTPGGYFPNSGFNETNFSGMVGVNKSWGFSHLNFSYFKNNIGFYEPNLDANGQFVDEDGNDYTDKDYKSRALAYPRQDIRHYKISLDNNFLFNSGSLKVTLGYQKNQRRELEEAIPGLFFDLNTYSADAKYYLNQKNGWEPVFGISTDAGQSQNKGTEFLIPAYDTYGLGAFGYIKKNWEKNTLNFGLRYDYRSNKGKGLVDDGEVRFTEFTNTASNISTALGFTHEFNEQLSFKANAGTAFRAPNAAELGSNGVHEGTYRYEVGNANLSPERSYQTDAALQYDSNIISAGVSIYNNYINNFIYAANTPGDETTVTDENGNSELFAVYRYRQVKANLYGAEANLIIHPVSFLHIDNTFGYTHAQNTTLNRPLSFIPAGVVRNSIQIEPKIKGLQDNYISFGIENYFTQNRVDTEFETPTAAYTLLNASAGATVKIGRKKVKIFVAANNLTNKRYYDALSRLKPGRFEASNPALGVYNPGRNITFGLNIPFMLSLAK